MPSPLSSPVSKFLQPGNGMRKKHFIGFTEIAQAQFSAIELVAVPAAAAAADVFPDTASAFGRLWQRALKETGFQPFLMDFFKADLI